MTAPGEEQFCFHLAQTRELGGHQCGRKLYETMLVWETDPALRDNELGAAFADAWSAVPKVVFSRTLDGVQGNARLAEAIELGLVEELRMFRNPVRVGGGTPFLPPVTNELPMELVETRTFGAHVIYERYRRPRRIGLTPPLLYGLPWHACKRSRRSACMSSMVPVS